MKRILAMTALLAILPCSFEAQAQGYDGATSVAVDRRGTVHVTGTSAGRGARSDIATVAYDADGNYLWNIRHDGGGDDAARTVALSTGGSITVAGWSRSDRSGTDVTLIGYSTTSGVDALAGGSGSSRLEFVPGRGDGSIDVRLLLGVRGHVRLGLYDLLGRHLSSLLDADLEPGRYSFPMMNSGLPPGCYVARLIIGDEGTPETLVTSIVLVR